MSDQTATPKDQAQPVAAPATVVPADASAAKDQSEWLSIMDQIGEEGGYFEPLGKSHWSFFHDDGPILLVTFEQLADIRTRPVQMPMGFDLAKTRGWSHLCLIADGETWYRSDRVYRYFDRLVDDAFFEDFDKVLFLGADQQAYAAAAFSVAAPGTSVLLVSPRASQDPEATGWDKRAPKARKLDFNSRYGYAPDMVEGTGHVAVIYDPEIAEDAMHAALFRDKHITHLRTPRLNGRVSWAFGHMQLWGPLVDAAMDQKLDRLSFARLWRARRQFGPYLRGLLSKTASSGKVKREKWLCSGVTKRLNAPTFRKRLNEILADEAAAEAIAAIEKADA